MPGSSLPMTVVGGSFQTLHIHLSKGRVLLFCYKKDFILSLLDKIRQMLLKRSILLRC